MIKYLLGGETPQILLRYTALINNGINPLVAFDTAHLSLVEDDRPGKYYGFGKRATNLQDWTKNAIDSLTIGRYRNLNDVLNFLQFKLGLKLKNYNNRPAFFTKEINRNRDKHKLIVNLYNQLNGLPLVSGLYKQLYNELLI